MGNLRGVTHTPQTPDLAGRVNSLFVHGTRAGGPLVPVDFLELIAGKGVLGDPRYFDRGSRRQVSLIAREEIAAHADALGLGELAPGVVRSNIETTGVDLGGLLGWEVRVGTAVLYFYAPRTPCAKMDAICKGLRERMGDGRQGVLAQIVTTGRVQPGDTLTPLRLVATARPHLP